MPKIWKYTLGRFGRILSLSALGFVALMLVMRLSDIAKFATQSSEFKPISLFILYQIPYILPIALPVSCFLAAILTMRSLCDGNELSAFRAAGLSLYTIATPVLCLSLFLVLLNFYFASELTPYCRGKSRDLIYQATAENPLYLLQKSKHLRFPDVEVDLKMVEPKMRAKNFVFAMFNPKSERLNFILARGLKLKNNILQGKCVTAISSMQKNEGFDHLVIENVKKTQMPSHEIAALLRKPKMTTTYDGLPFKLMRIKAKQEGHRSKTKRRFLFEVTRRASYGLAPLSFTGVGLSFGIYVGRRKNKKPLILGSLLAALMLISSLIGKSFEAFPLYAFLCYFLPHPFAWFWALRHKQRREKGIE